MEIQPPIPIGLAAFDSLHAETEDWLDQCRVASPDFDLVSGSRPYLVTGGEGSGKTALFQALRARLECLPDSGQAPKRLVVHWQPRPLPPGATGVPAAEAQLKTVLAGCANALLSYLDHWPQGFQAAPDDAQATLAWFICHYIEPEKKQRAAGSADHAAEEMALLQSLRLRSGPEEWLAHAEPNEVIAETIKALRAIGLEAVYVLVNPDDLGDSKNLAKDLEAFFSSLTLFENPHFIYKLILPQNLVDSLSGKVAIDRRRIQLAVLNWPPEDLVCMAEQRIRLATGSVATRLHDVCEDPLLSRWLERTGGNSPRGWLQHLMPVMIWYLKWKRPVTADEWREIRKTPPPALQFDAVTEVITVGWRTIAGVTEIPLALFAYLYEHPGRLCTRQELYDHAYLPAAYPDSPPGTEPAVRLDYDRILESTMSKLRQAIEPDPKYPIYLQTDRRRGYRLIRSE